ncbi:hypothetical protein CL622_05830 [archaeon]|nr:hypothetical protein [archaeon]|tara:strand:- start:1035 stop:1763 length:729 start_codon:yes stop_codon:yes gene_type:complete
MAELIEFKNKSGEVLRGLLDKTESDHGVIFLPGLGGTSLRTCFNPIREKILGETNIFRFDFSGSGLSDGYFPDITIRDQTEEAKLAINEFKQAAGLKSIDLVGHSLGGIIALSILSQLSEEIRRVLLLAPALNFKAVIENFTKLKSIQEEDGGKAFFWKNLKIEKTFFLENHDADYQSLLDDVSTEKLLTFHGLKDESVPINSLKILKSKSNFIEVPGGDHSLDHPEIVVSYISKAVKFLKE